MSLLEKIEEDLRGGIKSGDQKLVATLRMVKSDIMYEKTKTSGDISEEKVLEIVKRAAKKRKESISEYEKGGRAELAESEKEELDIIQKYLPEELSEEEVARIVDERLAALGEVSKSDFGKIMGPLMKELKGKVDGSVVKKVLTDRLKDK